MALSGMLGPSVLDHAGGCPEQEFTKCQAVVHARDGRPLEELVVVRMTWCGECGAADYEVV